MFPLVVARSGARFGPFAMVTLAGSVGHVSPAGGLPPDSVLAVVVCFNFFVLDFGGPPTFPEISPPPNTRLYNTTTDQSPSMVFGHLFGVSCQTGWDRKLRTGARGCLVDKRLVALDVGHTGRHCRVSRIQFKQNDL